MTVYKVAFKPEFSDTFTEWIKSLVTETMVDQSSYTMTYQIDSIVQNKILMNGASMNDRNLVQLLVDRQIQYVEL